MLSRHAAITRPAARRTVGQVRHAGGAPPVFPPQGRLFNEPILPKGQKRQKLPWENLWNYGFGGACLFGVLIAVNRPDTSVSTWALEEAKLRQQVSPTLPKYTPSSK
ncbi:hypothetical protein PYCC9005_004165 [Savitreella phatthalungensis]